MPVTSFATGLSTNFATLEPGSSVTGTPYCPCGATGAFVRPSDLQTSQTNLENVIEQVGKVLNTGQMQQMTAEEKLLNQQLQEESKENALLLKAQSQNHALQEISPISVSMGNTTVYTNQPGSLCNETGMATDLINGMTDNQQLATNMSGSLLAGNLSNDSAMSALRTLAHAPQSTLTASSLFPTAKNSSSYPTPQEAEQTIAHITEPVPPVQLSSAQKKTQAGKIWAAQQNAIQAKMSMAQNALATIAAWHQPTIDASYFIQKWDAMQKAAGNTNAGTPPGVNNSNKISPDGALNLMINDRYANPTWYKQMSVQNESGAIKDMTEMEAVSLRTHWEALRMSEYLAGLSADEYAQKVVGPTNNTLVQLNGNAMSQQNGAFNGQ